jgi:hypothetical protein
MADIRERDNDAVGSGVNQANSPLARARATSSDKMSDAIRAQIGSEQIAANVAANSAKRWGVRIFGRLHIQQWDDRDSAQECADKIGGEVIDVRG